ncbi:MAG: fimbrillin family protein, partial [Tannerella sp.]|nr:fimbrillin family protein [Tannerella sp.]
FSLSDFSLTPGQAQPFQARKTATASGYDATFEAYLIPSATVSGKRSVIFKVGGVLYEWIFAENVLFDSGKHYTFELTMMAN